MLIVGMPYGMKSKLILEETEKNFFDQSVGGNSPAYHAANYMFYKCYNIYFDPKYDSKNLY